MATPENSRNPSIMRDPPGLLRTLFKWRMDQVISPQKRTQRRQKAEAKRLKAGAPHRVEYFHQLDDPYSHLAAQTLEHLSTRYNIELDIHLIPATGGDAQPELEKLQIWARKDAERIAPYYDLSFVSGAPVVPEADACAAAAQYLAGLSQFEKRQNLPEISQILWAGSDDPRLMPDTGTTRGDGEAALKSGADRLKMLGHYSGAMFYYAGEWYWGIDRLFYLEERLRALGAISNRFDTLSLDYIAPRPTIDVTGIDASALQLDFYPSLNSPYTSIIYDKTIELKDTCGIGFTHKPVLPMIMRGVPAPRSKVEYILFDTKREAEFLGVPFGPMWAPIGQPTRSAYALFSWAAAQGKDVALMSHLLKCAFSLGIPLHRQKGMRTGIEAAGLNWDEAKPLLRSEEWKPLISSHQDDMIVGLGLWGVPSYRLSGPHGEPDIAVWGQDRLWLIAAEIRRRGKYKA